MPIEADLEAFSPRGRVWRLSACVAGLRKASELLKLSCTILYTHAMQRARQDFNTYSTLTLRFSVRSLARLVV